MVELQEFNYKWNGEKWERKETRLMCFRNWVNAFIFITKCRDLGKDAIAWHYEVYRMAKDGSRVTPIGCVSGTLFEKFYPSSDEDFRMIQRIFERRLAKAWKDGGTESSYTVGRY